MRLVITVKPKSNSNTITTRIIVSSIVVFSIFALFTASLFSMIAFTGRAGEGFIQQVVDSDNPYYFLRQAYAQVDGEATGGGDEPNEVVEEPVPPGDEPNGEVVVEPVPLPPPPPDETVTTTPPATTEGEPLSVSFSIDSTNGDTAPATFLFEADAQGGTGPYTYIWNFGDGSPQGSGISIHHTFEQAGTYDVTLAVIDSTGQDISVSRQVNVRPATTEQQPPTNATALPSMNQTNQTALTNATAVLEGCVTNPAGTIYCPYVAPTNGTTSALPLECVSTTAGIFCPSNETDPGVVEYNCYSNPDNPTAPLTCICKGAKDCLDLELSGRCEGHVIATETVGSCKEKRR
jgi:PKD repeat protein